MTKQREWDTPKRDLLDIERTAQAESVEAADHLADMADALAYHADRRDITSAVAYAQLVRRAVTAYRIARGQDTGDSASWTPQQILDHAG